MVRPPVSLTTIDSLTYHAYTTFWFISHHRTVHDTISYPGLEFRNW
jgi:hypothetical protein